MARFTNQAQLRYGDAVANSNIAVGEILEVLSATKTAVRSTYGPKDNVTYVISIVNSGTTAFGGITISDDLGTYTITPDSLTPLSYIAGSVKYYINGVLQTAPTVTAGPPLVISGLTIPAGGNATIVYEASVNEYAPLAAASTITNTATVSGGGVTPIEVEETINAASGPVLSITKSVSPVPVTENGTLTYTFLIQNSGNADANATTGVVVTDTFNPVLSNLTATFNGTALTAGTQYTYDVTTGVFSTTAGEITVPAATYERDPATNAWVVTPGVSTLTITGTI